MSTLLYSPLPPFSPKPPLHHLFSLRPPLDSIHAHKGGRRRSGAGRCRAEVVQDAPFAAAIGACVLAPLVLPDPVGGGEEDGGGEGGSAMDSTDARFAVMAVLSCIPYFNWLVTILADEH